MKSVGHTILEPISAKLWELEHWHRRHDYWICQKTENEIRRLVEDEIELKVRKNRL